MKTTTCCILWPALLLVGTASADQRATEDIDKEFGILEDEAAKELNAERLLAEAEKGLAPPKVMEFLAERLGGVLLDVGDSVRNDPENRARLDAIYEEIDRQGVPPSFDSTMKGWVTIPKHQRLCDSCAAFAATGIHESCLLRVGVSELGKMDLSEQQLINCHYKPEEGVKGCKGGAYMESYTKWLINNGGTPWHENQLPYQGNKPTYECPQLTEWKSGGKVTAMHVEGQCTEERMRKLIATYGAVMVGLNGTDSAFSRYGGGIIQSCSRGLTNYTINHAVVLVGYNAHNGDKYWIGKNSWGTTWGENGFFKIERGTNMCAVESICVAVSCIGNMTAEAPPPAPPAPVIPKKMTCDINSHFPNATGICTLVIGGGTSCRYESHLMCRYGICAPLDPRGITNACVYICGEVDCEY